MNNNLKILASLAIGVVAGTVLGVLFAPDKGYETRKKINEKAKKITDAVNENLCNCKDRMEDIKDDINQTVKEILG